MPAYRPVLERFWEKVDSSGGPEACWPWLGSLAVGGYGTINTGLCSVRAHRFMCELLFGPIPPGLHVCHHCDNPGCVNPRHLFLGTAKANMVDRNTKGRAASKAGVLNGQAKIDPDAVRAIRSSGESVAEIAERFGICKTSVRNIIKRRTWASVG